MFTKKDTPIEPCTTDDGNIFKHKTIPTAVDDCCESVCKPIIGETTVIYGLDGEKGVTGEDGLNGLDGVSGTDGTNGVGVPINGTTGQILAKVSGADYDTEWINSPESGLTEDVVVSNDGLGLTLPYTFLEGTSFTSAWKALTQKTFYPTYQSPTFSFTNNQSGLIRIGSVVNVGLTFTFTRGSILLQGVFQNPRAGVATTYNLNGVVQAGSTLTVANHTVTQGVNNYTGLVNFATGSIPLNSNGQALDGNIPPQPLTALSAGVSATLNTNFEGVYPLFATSSIINTATEQGLVSMTSANNIPLSLVAETGGNKQFFEIPDAWLTARALLGGVYFNPLNDKYDIVADMSKFTITSVTETIQGNIIPYKRYTFNGLDRSAVILKLIFQN